MIESINKLNRISREILQQTGREAHPAAHGTAGREGSEHAEGHKATGIARDAVGEDADATLGT
nr:hypothetical protein [Paraburkholderia sp. BL27I4N3]